MREGISDGEVSDIKITYYANQTCHYNTVAALPPEFGQVVHWDGSLGYIDEEVQHDEQGDKALNKQQGTFLDNQ
jgi:hypothetical protein